MIISSPHNAKVKELAALKRRPDRVAAGVMVVEGYEELMVALTSGAKPRELYYCPALMRTAAELELLRRVNGAVVVELSRPAFEKCAYRQSPDGWLAVFEAVETRLERLRVGERPLILVCEAVEKPGNLGAMLRTADAVGADAVIAPAAVTDWSNPNIARASKGTIFTVPVAEATTEELLAWLGERNIELVATTPMATQLYWEVDLTGGVAIAVGSEKDGLSEVLLKAAAVQVKIPMRGQIDSLNVATAGALLLYEAARQRQVVS